MQKETEPTTGKGARACDESRAGLGEEVGEFRLAQRAACLFKGLGFASTRSRRQ